MKIRSQHQPLVGMNTRSSSVTLLRSQLSINPSLGMRSLFEQQNSLRESTPLTPLMVWKERLGISDTLSVLSPRYKAYPQDLGLGIAVNLGAGSSSRSKSPNSRQPVGLRIGLPPLPKKKVDLVESLIPLFLVSSAYFSTYSVSELLLLLENIGMDSMWLKEMLGMSVTPSSSSDLVHAVQESGQSVGSDLQQVISNQQHSQYLRLLGLVAGSVAVGAIVLWVASYGLDDSWITVDYGIPKECICSTREMNIPECPDSRY